jgi:hypothetical protein
MTPPPSTQFKPLPRQEEIELLRNDTSTFAGAKKYLGPLIEQALQRFTLTPVKRSRLRRQLSLDIPIAAKRFLESPRSTAATYRFCTYFTWYIHRRIDAENLKRVR